MVTVSASKLPECFEAFAAYRDSFLRIRVLGHVEIQREGIGLAFPLNPAHPPSYLLLVLHEPASLGMELVVIGFLNQRDLFHRPDRFFLYRQFSLGEAVKELRLFNRR